ncbi:hypothetical protein [Halegenticoccus soli]|uniref:hypothetical protein n=1 Tax=Halegenticoccus soli TaxID=1985678 RepID=UPI001179F9C6|nr:hypothetical protein [Halegenticoccus soli]
MEVDTEDVRLHVQQAGETTKSVESEGGTVVMESDGSMVDTEVELARADVEALVDGLAVLLE